MTYLSYQTLIILVNIIKMIIMGYLINMQFNRQIIQLKKVKDIYNQLKYTSIYSKKEKLSNAVIIEKAINYYINLYEKVEDIEEKKCRIRSNLSNLINLNQEIIKDLSLRSKIDPLKVLGTLLSMIKYKYNL